MTRFIYYDLEATSTQDVAQARSRAPGAREFIPRGAGWPGEIGGDRPAEIPNSREFGYQQQLMDWVDRLFASIENSESGREIVYRDGISLLELVRFKFMLEFAETEQRLRVLSELSGRGADTIEWIIPVEKRQWLERLASEPGLPRVNIIPAAKRSGARHPVYQFARSSARRILERTADFAGRFLTGHAGHALKGRPVVFAEYFPNSAMVLLPVATALRDRHGIDVTWLALRKSVARMLDGRGDDSMSLRRAAPRAHWSRSVFGPAARRRLSHLLDGLSDELYAGTGSVPAKSYLVPAIVGRLQICLDEALYWLGTLSEAFDGLRPQCVVSTSYSSVFGRAAACAARRHDAGSVYVQHGMFPDCDFFAYFCHDRLLLWGDANRRTMLRNGVADSQVQVVGPTIYDDLVKRLGRSNPRLSRQPGEPIRVAYLASRTGGLAVNKAAAKSCFTTIAEAVAETPNARLIVKLHPGDKTGMLEELARSYSNIEIVKEGNAQDVICRCDVAIVVSSTTGLEACMAGRPLVVLTVEGVPDYGPYEQYGAALQVRLADRDAAALLARAIQSLAGDSPESAALDSGRCRLIDDILGGGAGDATNRAAEAISNFAGHRSRLEPQLNLAR